VPIDRVVAEVGLAADEPVRGRAASSSRAPSSRACASRRSRLLAQNLPVVDRAW
jgi:hypothetical protein